MVIPFKKIILHRLNMRMIFPFSTSFGTMQEKDFFIIEAVDMDGNRGFGESVAFPIPWYTEETVKSNKDMMEDLLIPILRENPIEHPNDVFPLFGRLRGNNMAKAAIEGAVWDLYAKREGLTLAKALGGEKTEIDAGISIGIQPTIGDLLEEIEGFLEQGYKRIKLKIKPGHDVDMLRQVRATFPDTPIMADANSAYTLHDIELLKQLDDLDLMMIEQPLQHHDIIDHAKLQKEIKTPICLDESIHSLYDAQKAIELGSCKIINIKVGRVGGLSESVKIHDYCKANGIPVWCGGMLEAGVGRAHNIAITTLSNFVLPGDTAGSSRYWERDIIKPEVIVENGAINVPTAPGIGYEIDEEALEEFRIEKQEFDM
ncbi:o-succinylbenzoate synthase [Paucisalibacillus globulus]|uniref:o-succinylbenzoate synthase n=1 Tax=Paucisalibacillus globulus TaxID=351095 RepID=UPI0004294EB7|nr:o-succinylbenzoate synthase [Paucisalibacillus globulus]